MNIFKILLIAALCIFLIGNVSAVDVDDNSTVDIDIDIIDDQVDIKNNTISFDTNDFTHKGKDYFVLDYTDTVTTKSISKEWTNENKYSYDLVLKPNTNYNYTFYGYSSYVGHLNGKPWTYGLYSYSDNIMFGNFKTDKNCNIIDFTHNLHIKLKVSNGALTRIYQGSDYPLMGFTELNGESVVLSTNKPVQLNHGKNVLRFSPLNFNGKWVYFDIILHGKLWIENKKIVSNKIPIYKTKKVKLKSFRKTSTRKVKIVGKKDIILLKMLIKRKWANPYKFWFIKTTSNGYLNKNYKYVLKVKKTKKKVFDPRYNKKVPIYKVKVKEYKRNTKKVKYIAGYKTTSSIVDNSHWVNV